jgi:hypothetical protein
LKVKKVLPIVKYVLPKWIAINIRTRAQIRRIEPHWQEVPYKFNIDLKKFKAKFYD